MIRFGNLSTQPICRYANRLVEIPDSQFHNSPAGFLTEKKSDTFVFFRMLHLLIQD